MSGNPQKICPQTCPLPQMAQVIRNKSIAVLPKERTREKNTENRVGVAAWATRKKGFFMIILFKIMKKEWLSIGKSRG